MVDEKNFIVDEVTHGQNIRVVAFNTSDIPPVMQSKNQASDIIFFFSYQGTINKEA